jgi:hypothetical protein
MCRTSRIYWFLLRSLLVISTLALPSYSIAIDKAVPQVIIETKIIEATDSFTKGLGIQWYSLSDKKFSNEPSVVNVPPPVENTTASPSLLDDITNNLLFSTLKETDVLTILKAAESSNNVNILSNPKITTTNNEAAEINLSKELILEVRPMITRNDDVMLEVIPNVSGKRVAETNIVVPKEKTMALGGLSEGIPSLEYLFKKDPDTDAKKELLIFLTPRVIKEGGGSGGGVKPAVNGSSGDAQQQVKVEARIIETNTELSESLGSDIQVAAKSGGEGISVHAAGECPCDEIAKKLAEARKKLKSLEVKLKALDKELKANEKSQKDAEKRIADIDKEIEKQEGTFVSTVDASGATIRSQYDLKTGERVTTRTPPGGKPTEINREPSRYLKRLRKEKTNLNKMIEDLKKQEKELQKQQKKTKEDIKKAQDEVQRLRKELNDCLKSCKPMTSGPFDFCINVASNAIRGDWDLILFENFIQNLFNSNGVTYIHSDIDKETAGTENTVSTDGSIITDSPPISDFFQFDSFFDISPDLEAAGASQSAGGAGLNLVSQQDSSGGETVRAVLQDPTKPTKAGNAGLPADPIFADGFESGDVSAWSSFIGGPSSATEKTTEGEQTTGSSDSPVGNDEVTPDDDWEKRLSEDFLRDSGDSETPFEWDAISPRVSLTYDIFSNGKTLFKSNFSSGYFPCNPLQDNTIVDLEGEMNGFQPHPGDRATITGMSDMAFHTLDGYFGSDDTLLNFRSGYDLEYSEQYTLNQTIAPNATFTWGQIGDIYHGTYTQSESFGVNEGIYYDFDRKEENYLNSVRDLGLNINFQLADNFQVQAQYGVSRQGQSQSKMAAGKAPSNPPAKKGSVPSDPYFHSNASWGQDVDDQWGLKRIGFESVARGDKDALWPRKAKPVIVAVVDSGIDFGHPDLYGTAWVNLEEIPNNGKDDDENGLIDDFYGWNYIDDNNNVRDLNGHGTFVAGIIAAATDNGFGIAGVNPWARIMPVKVTDFSNHGNSIDLAKGISYAADMGARVINVSVGGHTLTDLEQAAIDEANAMGALVVVAAGNGPTNVKDFSPAGLDGVITVAATDRNDKRLGFSNWGEAVDIAAPGIDILSLRAIQTDLLQFVDEQYQRGSHIVGANRFYYHTSGTSFSAPFVSGVASLLFAKNPDLTPEQVKRIILNSARDIEVPGWDQLTGYGLLDAKAALAATPGFFLESRILSAKAIEESGQVWLELAGTADADQLKKAWIEIGKGDNPEEWKVVVDEINKPVRNGLLATIPSKHFIKSGEWVIRLVTEHKNGERRESRFRLKTS